MSGFTPGPWRWEVSLKSKAVSLNGGRPRYDLTVMDFVRWGMGGASPRLLKESGLGLMLMERADAFTAIVPGREHHSDWFRTLDHPDARLIAAAPDLYAALNELRINANRLCDRQLGGTYEDDCRRSLAVADAALEKVHQPPAETPRRPQR